MYEILMDENRWKGFTQSNARISKEVGGQFTLFDGSVTGMNEELQEGKLIVQKWRFASWADGIHSTVRIVFDEPEAGVTVIKLTQTNVPEEDRYGNSTVVENTERGWRDLIFQRIRGVFGAITVILLPYGKHECQVWSPCGVSYHKDLPKIVHATQVLLYHGDFLTDYVLLGIKWEKANFIFHSSHIEKRMAFSGPLTFALVTLSYLSVFSHGPVKARTIVRADVVAVGPTGNYGNGALLLEGKSIWSGIEGAVNDVGVADGAKFVGDGIA
ncbi:uncharacterized protein A4U43_C08F29260 [Asparagus officinalis]|nr:uncharacterized protein A4U43_C08F29260 [Asparagus officinalis]